MFLLYYEKVRFNVPCKSCFRASNSLKFEIFCGFAPSPMEQIYSAPRSHSCGSVLEEKSLFKMLGLTFSSKLDWGSYIISIAKSASRKIGVLIHSMKFLSHEVALYLYKSSIRPCMKYCGHIWAGAPFCYLELLDKLQKRICRTVGPSRAASFEPLAQRQNIASLSLFYRYFYR